MAVAFVLDTSCGKDQDISNRDMANPDQGPPVSPFPKLGTPPGCDQLQSVPLNEFYYNLINNQSSAGAKCANSTSCHAAGGQMPIFGPDLAAFRSSVVNVSANRNQQPTLMYVKPNDIDNSFLLYKILGQQFKIQHGNATMPLDMTLPGSDICILINWVRTGAN